MTVTTPSQARNMIRKSLLGIIDPDPSKEDINIVQSLFHQKHALVQRSIYRSTQKSANTSACFMTVSTAFCCLSGG